MNNPTNHVGILTVAQAARQLGVTPAQVRDWAKSGVLSPVLRGQSGRLTHVLPAAIDKLMTVR